MGIIVSGVRAIRRIWSKKWTFLALFVLIFLLMVLVLSVLDLLPEGPKASAGGAGESPVAAASPAEPVSVPVPQEPVKIEIKKIGLVASIANPETTNSETLDNLLLKGAVRYPTSARLGVEGNVVLFGHSSYLPVVKNLAYKTFDDIQKLKQGDTVTVFSPTTAYTYEVRAVAKETASEGAIPLKVTGKVLTLVTCNSFATKSDRFVVTANFVESHPLGV